MTSIETVLRNLDTQPPHDLERSTTFGVGAADLASTIDSPIGPVWVAWSTRGVTAVAPLFATESFVEFATRHRRVAYEETRVPRSLENALTLALENGDATEVDIDLTGLGRFQVQVLESCSTIPSGTVRSYGWIAEQIDNPGSVRAVGTALGTNPIPLVVPCHRVVRSDGSVGNYAFGPDIKRDLLISEGAILA